MNSARLPTMRHALFILGILASGVAGVGRAAPQASATLPPRAPAADPLERRLFDFAPAGQTNPVVFTLDDGVAVPLSEVRAYGQAERPKALAPAAPVSAKRALAEELVGEYLLIDEAYRSGATAHRQFLAQMTTTRTMLLSDMMLARECQEHHEEAPAAMNRIFDAASLDVSNEAYAAAVGLAARVDAVTNAAKVSASVRAAPAGATGTDTVAALRTIIDCAPEAVVVRYLNKTISVRQVVAIYASMPAPRPAIAQHAAFLEMIKPLVVPELLTAEAVQRGFENDPSYREKLIQNRNTLLRFHMQAMIEREANTRLQQPELEPRLRAWYDAHRSLYPTRGAGDGFAAARSRVLGDYSVAVMEEAKAARIAALRQQHPVLVNDAALEKL